MHILTFIIVSGIAILVLLLVDRNQRRMKVSLVKVSATMFLWFAALGLVSCQPKHETKKVPSCEIELHDPKGFLSGNNAQLTVVTGPHPRASSGRARIYLKSDQIFRLTELTHSQKYGWILASPDFLATEGQMRQYVFEFNLKEPLEPGVWSGWMPAAFVMGKDDWDLIYGTGREQRLPLSEDIGLLMRYRITTTTLEF